jgi:hypothetical protein
MLGPVEIRQAAASEVDVVSDLLWEAASWLLNRGIPLWSKDDVGPSAIAGDVRDGRYYLAFIDRMPVGTFRYDLEDRVVWPDDHSNDSAYVHRIAISRAHAGGTLSRAILRWSVHQAKKDDRMYLRLDCEAGRSRLRAVYEGFGFLYHSDARVGPYHVARYQLPTSVVA